jgi:hypothetical protein
MFRAGYRFQAPWQADYRLPVIPINFRHKILLPERIHSPIALLRVNFQALNIVHYLPLER